MADADLGGLGLSDEELRKLAELIAQAQASQSQGQDWSNLGAILAAGSLSPRPRDPGFAQFIGPNPLGGVPGTDVLAPRGLAGGVNFLGGSLIPTDTPQTIASSLSLLTNLAEGLQVAKQRIDEGRARREREKQAASGTK